MKKLYLIASLLIVSLIIFQLRSCSTKEASLSYLKSLVDQLDSMTKINDSPYPISSTFYGLCNLPTPSENTRGKGSPHEEHFINVYVNDIGKNAMTSSKNPDYPIGTVIIKEKSPSVFDPEIGVVKTDVDLYTIMVKREKGYNPECGDWEFAAIDGKLEEFERGKIQKCMDCHKTIDKLDFVFRDDYLGKEYKEKLLLNLEIEHDY